MENNEEAFGKRNVSETVHKLHDDMESVLAETEVFLSLPIDYIKQNMSHDDFMAYIALRNKTIHLLELLEVFVYDTHEDAMYCCECGETQAKVVTRRLNGNEVETLNGEIEHWVSGGKIQHIFICEECIKRQRQM